MIELKHINKIYNGFNALNDISLTIKDGEICGIIGQSGAGKSTLVRCINMLEPPTSGDVIVNGRNMVTLSKRELREERKKIGMIFSILISCPAVLYMKMWHSLSNYQMYLKENKKNALMIS